MSHATADDGQERFALGLVFILIALVVSVIVGTVVVKQRGVAPQAATAALGTVSTVSTGAAGAASSGAAPAVAEVAQPAPQEPAALAPEAVVLQEQAAVRVDGDVVKFFFATGQAEVAEGAEQALAQVLEGVQAGQAVRISGFHDATGDLGVNEQLAKRRAEAVQAKLVELGVAEKLVELVKPEQIRAGGSNAEARRVEVTLVER